MEKALAINQELRGIINATLYYKTTASSGWCGVVWRGVVLCGVVLCGVVWRVF
jgi:hypothetical protein